MYKLIIVLMIFFSASTFADGVIDSNTACADIQNSSIRLACTASSTKEGIPIFLFTFDETTNREQAALLMLRVMTPACLTGTVIVGMKYAYTENIKIAKCTPPGNLSDFVDLNESM
jgi:hypothetical protein